ncbi:MAG: sulfatase [Myxococcota bacterium]|nr:sulfatase [Myxococcota bacterium]
MALIGLSIALASCGVPDRPPSIVLISVDSLRADRLGIYGADRNTSPSIDALAAEGALFETAVAPSPWTLASHVTLFTGLPVSTHRVSAPDRKLDSARQPLAQHLAELGYKTAAFVSSPFLDRAYGVDRGFETYVNFQGTEAEEFPPGEDAHERSHRDRSASAVVDAALAWMKSDAAGSQQPWFLFVHIWDVHYDYDPPAPYDSMFDPDYAGNLDSSHLKHNPAIHAGMSARDLIHLRALYDGEVRWVDSQLERLFAALRVRERSEAILVSLVADHGEEFFEHGNKSHFKTLFDESLRVPWIVRYPGVVGSGIRIGGVAGLEDVAPTLLGLAGLAPLAEASGRNLEDAVENGGEATRPQLLHFGLQRALRGPDWKVTFRTDTKEAVYYDLSVDPLEQAPMPASDAAPKRLTRLRNRLNRAQSIAESLHWEAASEVELDQATSERLKELGYIE